MIWTLYVVATAACCELCFRFPFKQSIQELKHCVTRVRDILMSKRISDHWKERSLPIYALRIGTKSIVLLGLLLLCLFPYLVVGASAEYFKIPFIQRMAEGPVLAGMTSTAALYLFQRAKL